MIGIKVKTDDKYAYVTMNYRHIVENGWLEDLKYLCEPTEYHEKRVCIKFICSIGISRELNRHRVNSISERSTRYCNFSKDKFGNEISFIEPSWYKNNIDGQACLIKACEEAESHYLWMVKELHMKPQQAREVLPLATATEVNHCAFISDWKHFFELRDNSAAHPDMVRLVKPLHEEFIKLGYLKNE